MSKFESALTGLGSGIERVICGLLDGLGRIFEHGTRAMSRVAIPLADLVVSYVAAQVIAQQMGLAWGLALAAGIAMEGTGVLAAETPLEQHRFNQESDTDDAKAPELFGWITFALQTAFSTVLIVLNAAGPEARLFRIPWLTLPVFGMMTLSVQSLAATVAAGLYADLKARERSRTRRAESDRRERERTKAERRAARQAAKSATVPNDPAPVPERPERTERQERIVQYVMEHRNDSLNEIGQALELSKTMVQGELAKVGWHKNGHGWEGA